MCGNVAACLMCMYYICASPDNLPTFVLVHTALFRAQYVDMYCTSTTTQYRKSHSCQIVPTKNFNYIHTLLLNNIKAWTVFTVKYDPLDTLKVDAFRAILILCLSINREHSLSNIFRIHRSGQKLSWIFLTDLQTPGLLCHLKWPLVPYSASNDYMSNRHHDRAPDMCPQNTRLDLSVTSS
jgi:hypothetical protein